MRREACWALSNICNNLKDENDIENLMNQNILEAFLGLISRDSESGTVMLLVMQGLSFLLTRSSKCRERFELLGGISELEDL